MGRFAEAKFTIRAVNKTQQAFSQINKNVGNMDRRFSKLGSSLNRIGGLMATAFVGRQIVDTITKFEKLEASLRTVTGSADKAALAFGFIQNFAATTPFQLEEVTDAFIKLKALGLTPSEDALTSYGNTATAMGKSLNQMIEAVADAATGEFERLKEFGIKAKSQGDQVTFTFQGISTTVGKNSKEIEDYLRSIGNVQFAGAMKEQAGTLNVALSNMGDAFSKLVKAIGDAGLTDLLMAIANGVKWLAEQITNAIEPFKLGFKAIIAEVIKFGNLFIAVFKGVGRAFASFGDTISARFEALGKDLAAFIEDPLGGVSFENTRAALETGLLDAMGTAFDQALTEAREFNAAIDAEIQGAAMKVIEARQKKNASLASLFEETQTPEKTEETSKATEKFTKLQREAERIIESTRTPLERYNKEMEILNKLLKEGHINQETFGRATEQAQEKLKKSSEKMGDLIEGEFEGLGKTMEGSMADALDGISGRFDSFGDFAKGFLSDLNRQLLQFALKDLGITGEGGIIEGIFGSLGGLFKGGGGGGIGSLFSSAASLFGGFFADGGTLKAGQFGVVGGRLGEITLNSQMFQAEVRGLTQHLSQTIGQVFSPSCRAILGDSRCKVALASFTVAATVTEVTNNQTFKASTLAQAAGWFTGGEVEWTSGNNDGRRMEVKEFASTQVVLALPMGKSIQVGDTLSIIAGCDKTRETCQSKFTNILNFRGEPDVPGTDKLLTTAGTMNKANQNG